jgi:hypothetical protein
MVFIVLVIILATSLFNYKMSSVFSFGPSRNPEQYEANVLFRWQTLGQ